MEWGDRMNIDTTFIVIITGAFLFAVQAPLSTYDPAYFYPTVLYKNTKMNIFGCIICSILLFTINFGYCTVYCLCNFIHWLFTVGRKTN